MGGGRGVARGHVSMWGTWAGGCGSPVPGGGAPPDRRDPLQGTAPCATAAPLLGRPGNQFQDVVGAYASLDPTFWTTAHTFGLVSVM